MAAPQRVDGTRGAPRAGATVIARRALLRAAMSLAALPWAPRRARASSRTPYGGRVDLHVPWPLSSVDPHRIDDPAAALFGDALFESLYARDEAGAFVPSLAEGDPQPDGKALRVPLRPGLRFASGSPLDARAAAASIARARSHDAAAWLAEIPAPRIDQGALVFSVRDVQKLVRALASPLVAVVPPRFLPERPDGTGPLRADLQPGVLVLSRNILAANGPAFLDAIDARHAGDLITSLRAFESRADDVGWLGSFLHEPRQGAHSFDGGVVAWAVLRTGRDAGSLHAQGIGQALADGIPHAALASLVVGTPWPTGSARWTGGPCDLCVRDDAPWLMDLARAVAAALSSAAHEVTARPIPSAEIVQRRATGAFALMLDVARPAGPGAMGTLIGLATADDPASAVALVRHPPRTDFAPRIATRTMRLGVVAEVRIQGGRAPDLVLPPSPWGRGIDWGSAYRTGRA